MESPIFAFDNTNYYQSSMGENLKKVFYVFERSFDPSNIVDVKLETNRWESECAEEGKYSETRPLNLDPGYLTLSKLVLASTKDFAHRIYLDRGVYAEITLYYRQHRWQSHQYTFDDYRSDEYHRFFSGCREYLHRLKQEGSVK